MNRYGFEEAVWEAGKAQATAILRSHAKSRQMIPYSDFVACLDKITFDGPHDSRLPHFLGEISTAESEAGRGMITALVVHKSGDYQPGPGFFELAQALDRDVKDIEKCWVKELKKVFAANNAGG